MVRFLVLFSYLGEGYSGLQVQTDRGVKTVIGVLQTVLKELNKNVVISPEKYLKEAPTIIKDQPPSTNDQSIDFNRYQQEQQLLTCQPQCPTQQAESHSQPTQLNNQTTFQQSINSEQHSSEQLHLNQQLTPQANLIQTPLPNEPKATSIELNSPPNQTDPQYTQSSPLSNYTGSQPTQPSSPSTQPTHYSFKDLFYDTKRLRLVTSSRTDKGVNALCNTAHVDLKHPVYKEADEKKLLSQCNDILHQHQENISILRLIKVGDDFHSRYNALARSYAYRLCVIPVTSTLFQLPLMDRGRVMLIKRPLDMEAVRRAAEMLSGCHDYRGFTTPMNRLRMEADEKCCQQNIEVRLKPSSTMLLDHFNILHSQLYNNNINNNNHKNINNSNNNFTYNHINNLNMDNIINGHHGPSNDMQYWDLCFHGSSFLYKQVRRMVGMLISVGMGHHSIDDVSKLLSCDSNYTLNPVGFPDVRSIVADVNWTEHWNRKAVISGENVHEEDEGEGLPEEFRERARRRLLWKLVRWRVQQLRPSSNTSYESFELPFRVPPHALYLTNVHYPGHLVNYAF